MKAGKGSAFEREICKRLSRWWSDGATDAVFWRTSNSGGRASSRAKKGEVTKNQHGDICAIDHVGLPFLEVVAVELKRGYSRDTVADLLDASAGAAKQTYEKWVEQARESQEGAGSFAWLIVHRRNQRVALVTMPQALWQEIHWPLFVVGVKPVAEIHLELGRIVCVRLEDFLKVSPDRFRTLALKARESKDAKNRHQGKVAGNKVG